MRSYLFHPRVVLVSAALVAASAVHAAGVASVRLKPGQDVLLADGKSSTPLTAEVFDDRGAPVPDGTLVRFTSSSGRLDQDTAATRNGVARVILVASDLPGVAFVTAFVDSNGITSPPDTRQVTFTSDAEASSGSNWARIEGTDYVGYALDFEVIQAIGKNGGARVHYRNLEISADTLQVKLSETTVRASGNVVLQRGKTRRTYRNLRFNLLSGEGVGERDGDGRPEPVTIKGLNLEEKAATEPITPDTFEAEDISGAGMTVVSRSIFLEPNSRLQFRRATFYLDGKKTLSLPYHVLPLGQKSLFSEQIVGYGPGGLTVDFPLQYDVRPSTVGTLHLRHGARVGTSAYATRAGWNLDLEHAYSGRNAVDGLVEVTGMTRQDWGARLTHSQNLDAATRGFLFVDFPRHRDLFGNTLLTRRFAGFTLNANASASRSAPDDLFGISSPSFGDLRAQLYAETDARPLLGQKTLRYSLNLGTLRQSFFGSNAPKAYTTQTASVRMYTTPLRLDRRTSLQQSLSVGQTWASGGSVRDGLSLRGTVSLARTLGRLGAATLNYDYTQTPEFRAHVSGVGKHRLGAMLLLGSGDRWSLTANGSKSLDGGFTTLYSTAQFSLGGPWRGRVTLAATRFASMRYQDVEYALIRNIGGRDIALYYSTTTRRLQLDLTGARF